MPPIYCHIFEKYICFRYRLGLTNYSSVNIHLWILIHTQRRWIAWALGLINTATNEIRLELITNRNENILKPIIEKHVGPGNIICSDSWAGYNFLSRVNSGYEHEASNHQIGRLHELKEFGEKYNCLLNLCIYLFAQKFYLFPQRGRI